MQNTRTNELVPGDLSEDMRQRFTDIQDKLEGEVRRGFDATGKVRTADQGPLFRVGEVVPIKGYGYKVVRIKANGIAFKPHGPL